MAEIDKGTPKGPTPEQRIAFESPRPFTLFPFSEEEALDPDGFVQALIARDLPVVTYVLSEIDERHVSGRLLPGASNCIEFLGESGIDDTDDLLSTVSRSGNMTGNVVTLVWANEAYMRKFWQDRNEARAKQQALQISNEKAVQPATAKPARRKRSKAS